MLPAGRPLRRLADCCSPALLCGLSLSDGRLARCCDPSPRGDAARGGLRRRRLSSSLPVARDWAPCRARTCNAGGGERLLGVDAEYGRVVALVLPACSIAVARAETATHSGVADEAWAVSGEGTFDAQAPTILRAVLRGCAGAIVNVLVYGHVGASGSRRGLQATGSVSAGVASPVAADRTSCVTSRDVQVGCRAAGAGPRRVGIPSARELRGSASA